MAKKTYKKTYKKKSFRYKLWEPRVPKNKNFPITYDLEAIPDDNVDNYLDKTDIELDFYFKDDLKELIRKELMGIFPFFRYTDINSPEYIGRENNLEYLFKVNIYKLVSVDNRKSKKKEYIKTGIIKLKNFHTDYQFNLIRSLDQLKEVLKDVKKISFDLEKTGLHPIDDYITGAAFSLEPRIGYYLPVRAIEEFQHLTYGFEGLDILYEALCKAELVIMFNAEFDMRAMRLCERKYDFSKINYFDAQLPAWYMDPDNKQTSLKWFEKYLLGYYRDDLHDTMRSSGLDTYNTSMISPENILFYGAQDGISTFELYLATLKYHKEFGISAQIDQELIYPLMIMKEHPTRINTKLLAEELEEIVSRLDELEELMHKQIGDINLNSSPQKIALFESFGLDTGVKTDTGNMSTGREAVENLISKMENAGKDIPEWLQYLGERSELEKLRSTYFGPLKVQAELNGGKVRINYRNTNAGTGRLSSGKFIYE
jgi:DNA polymerase I-like protein with 3'-5' exonuclease and polymerase domains